MDTSASACDNFYQYACGGFEKKHTLPDDKGRYGTFDAVDENVKKRLQTLYSNVSSVKEIEPLAYVRDLYQSCNDSGKQSNPLAT